MSLMLQGEEIRTTVQLLRLLELMQENHFVNGRLSPIQTELKQIKFEEIADELNALGPEQRDGIGWKKYFYSLKLHVLSKVFSGKFTYHQPDQNFDPKCNFREWEKRTIKMLNLEHHIVPIKDGKTEPAKCDEDFYLQDSHYEILMNINSSDAGNVNIAAAGENDYGEHIEDEAKFDPTCLNNPTENPSKLEAEELEKISNDRVNNEEDFPGIYDYIKIMQKQASRQKHFYEKMSDEMESIQNSFKSIEESIKTSVSQKDELLELKREKLKLLRGSMVEQENYSRKKILLKTELFELQRQ